MEILDHQRSQPAEHLEVLEEEVKINHELTETLILIKSQQRQIPSRKL